ncbi:hypothetical protein B0I35DRAFT_201212 [Stachybotrys elegans]|uniref:Uncharacterized protein n=1 Tax=Stachybotrys elegans TaxID=80388 RepID=A0A8K0SUB2_9HYPO|nr:hypothetical protein B0I35DRAFT_201212 [Stachybotrys elegans]
MESSLPSYRAATTPVHWLEQIAPYVDFTDYPALCLVNHHCWGIFAPLLWNDLLRAARLSGLDPSDDINWWLNFVFKKLPKIRRDTRRLVRVLDARKFASDAYHFSADQHEYTLPHSFKRALTLLDRVDSLLLEGHADLDPSNVLDSQLAAGYHHRLRLLSIGDCPFHLPANFFASPYLQDLVYLDLSRVPGSIRHLIQPALLPHLRVLKIRGREVEDEALAALVNLFRLHLWSLDLSDNKITDVSIDPLIHACFPATDLRSDVYFDVEGRLVRRAAGDPHRGLFVFLLESDVSGSFSHPQRYLADAPAYTAEHHAEFPEYRVSRSNGCSSVLQDTAESVSRILAGGNHNFTADDIGTSRGLTHLRLSRNQVSSFGLVKLLQSSNGQLHILSCDSMPLLPHSGKLTSAWPRSAKLHGILGEAYLFRPVISSNLRVLQIHHSLVTHCPALEMDGLSTLARYHLAESSILPRVQQLFPQSFAPDMNPRLVSLTLTCVPRRSSGPLINSLIRFLRQLSEQEQAIREAGVASWRSPHKLQGLRHLRLEFEPDPMIEGFSTSEDLDAEELMTSGEQGFSFFDERRENPAKHISNPDVNMSLSDGRSGESSSPIRDSDTFLSHHSEWNGEKFSVPVWIGEKRVGARDIKQRYRQLVVEHGLRDGVGPVTPAQIMAGLPKESYIFHTAWCASVMPSVIDSPSTVLLSGMKDVIHELKQYRLAGRARYEELGRSQQMHQVPLGSPHYFWTGRLEVSTEQPMPQSRSTQYWR